MENQITKQDYLNAKELIKNYKLQQLNVVKVKTNKRVVLLENSNDKIIEILKNHFFNNKYLYFTQLVKVIQLVYEESFSQKIGRNNAVILIGLLKERGIIIKKGEFGFAQYFLNQ
jgi:hypothetical protein